MQRYFGESWAAIMVAGAFLAGLLLGGASFRGEWTLGWNAASAMGAFAAAGTALWIAGQEARRQHREAHDRSVVFAARIYLPLAAYTDSVNKLADWFEYTKPSMLLARRVEIAQQMIADILRFKPVKDEDIPLLIGLGDQTAMVLARAYANLDEVSRLFERIFFPYGDKDLALNWTTMDRMADAGIVSLARETHQLFCEAKHRCDDAIQATRCRE